MPEGNDWYDRALQHSEMLSAKTRMQGANGLENQTRYIRAITREKMAGLALALPWPLVIVLLIFRQYALAFVFAFGPVVIGCAYLIYRQRRLGKIQEEQLRAFEQRAKTENETGNENA